MNKLLFTNIHWITLFSGILIIIIVILVFMNIQNNKNKLNIMSSNIDKRIEKLEKNLLDNNTLLSNSANETIGNITNSTNYLKQIIEDSLNKKFNELINFDKGPHNSIDNNSIDNNLIDNNLIDNNSIDNNSIDNFEENLDSDSLQPLENSDSSLENSDSSLENSDSSLENSDSSLENSDSLLENSEKIGNVNDQLINKSKNYLMDLCVQRNLAKSGNKDILISRLLEDGYTK